MAYKPQKLHLLQLPCPELVKKRKCWVARCFVCGPYPAKLNPLPTLPSHHPCGCTATLKRSKFHKFLTAYYYFTPLLLSRCGLGSGAFNIIRVTPLRSALCAQVTNCSRRSLFASSRRWTLNL